MYKRLGPVRNVCRAHVILRTLVGVQWVSSQPESRQVAHQAPLNDWARRCIAADRNLGLEFVRVGGRTVGLTDRHEHRSDADAQSQIATAATETGATPPLGASRPMVLDSTQKIHGDGVSPPSTLVPMEPPPHVAPQGLWKHIPHLPSACDVSLVRSRDERRDALEALREKHDRECPHCTSATYHTRTVFGEGNCEAVLMFVGEAPGETEDQMGRPFVGRAGQKLDEMIRAIGFQREDVYIANVLKSRPPENRTPLQHEVDRCGPYLIEQIRIIRPRVLVTLGGPATKLLLATELGITRLRGVWASLELHDGGAGNYPSGNTIHIPVMPTFHPAYLLRNYTAETRRQVWSDLQAVVRTLGM
jgi:uracil-DNA glycosylase